MQREGFIKFPGTPVGLLTEMGLFVALQQHIHFDPYPTMKLFDVYST
jgi:hypothetical protein